MSYKILITGSDGKIGKELVRKLDGNELLLVDRKGEGSIKCDLAIDDLEFIRDFSPNIIIHLAASFERTDETPEFHTINYNDNIKASYRLNKLIASFNYCPIQYIFASSYLVYDPILYLSHFPTKAPRFLSEVDEVNPRNLIGASKLYVENEIEYLSRNIHKNMLVTHARIFRVYGEGGQDFVTRVMNWKNMMIPVDIWKPENKFDFVHTSDCADALVALFGYGGIYNVGSNFATSIQDIINVIQPKIRMISKNDLYESSCADTSKITETTGWVPKVSVTNWVKRKV